MKEQPAFRGSIPAYKPPDREAWAKTHGAPYPLEDVPQKFVSRALAGIEKDYATLDFSKAVNAHASLDMVCTDVAALLTEGDGDLVFFDPELRQFWVYPK